MKRGMIIAALAASALGVGAAATFAQVVSPQDVVLPGIAPTGLAQEKQALLAARRQAAEARDRSGRLQVQAQRATQDAEKARRWAAALAARIQESEADIQAAQARIAIVARLQRAQNARLAEKQQPIVRLTAALQILARRPTALALVQPGSISDAVHMRAVLGTVMPVIQERTAGLRAELARSRQLRSAAEQAAASLRDSRQQLASRQQELRRMETAKLLASRDYEANAGLESDRAVALGEKARDIVDLMDQLAVASDVRSELAALPGPVPRPAQPGSVGAPTAEPPVSNTGLPPYRLPVVGTLVTGMGELSESGVRARGLTLATQPGAQVVAPTAGRVAYAGRYRGYGQIVIIDHGQGWTTLITGLNHLSVTVGAGVAQGDPIGTAGAPRPTVTIELRRNGRPVDIVPLVGLG
ncbi:MAG TPA: peptidoglycan DD-metalloendopeptidase family protein [Sphingobium sp.]